jgi:hypothetical protein
MLLRKNGLVIAPPDPNALHSNIRRR